MANHLRNESTKGPISIGHISFPKLDKNQRESDRIFLSLHIRVSSSARNGKDLWQDGRTVDVSRRGAAIMADLQLSPGQNIKIQRVGLGKEAMARVVGRIAGWSEARVFGVRCATNSWVSAGPGRAILPEFLPAATHPATAQRDDGVGAPDGPMHSGALESLSNDRFTACLDDARPNE